MSPQYGNHIGIIINSLDPEGRGRVQVLIPHLSTTLFNQWNINAQDIKLEPQTFQEYLKQDHPVGKTLRENLPWAEAARPLMGSGGTTSAGLDGKIGPSSTPSQPPDQRRLSFPNASATINPKSSTSPDPNSPENKQPPECIIYKDGNFAFKDHPFKYQGRDVQIVTPDDVRAVAYDIANQNWDSIKEALGTNRPALANGKNVTFSTPEEYVDNFIIPMVKFESDFVVATTSRDNGNNTSVGLLQSSVPDYTTRIKSSVADSALFQRYDISLDKIENDKKLTIPLTNLEGGMALIELGLRKSPNLSVTQAMAGKEGKPDAQHPWLFGPNTINRLNDYYANGGFLPGDKSLLNDLNKAGGTFGFNERQISGSNIQPSQTPKPSTAMDISIAHPSKGADYRLPQGTNSVPQPGNMVWVFFLNGDLQKPVYFASVTEAYANARDGAVPRTAPASAPVTPKPFRPLRSPGVPEDVADGIFSV